MTRHIEIFWFQGCPNHTRALEMVQDTVRALGVEATIDQVEVPDEEAGNAVRFPGSPTIRVDGIDIEPGFPGCEDCTPRCRVYLTERGLTGLPERAWLESVLR